METVVGAFFAIVLLACVLTIIVTCTWWICSKIIDSRKPKKTKSVSEQYDENRLTPAHQRAVDRGREFEARHAGHYGTPEEIRGPEFPYDVVENYPTDGGTR